MPFKHAFCSGRWLFALFVFSVPSAVQAQIILPGAADPSRQILQAIPAEPESQDYVLPRHKPKAAANVPAAIANVKFRLKSLSVQGATAYPKELLAQYYAGDLGKDISVADLYTIMVRIQQRYLDDGYTFTKVSIPTQELKNGDIVFKVVEGYVGEVQFEKQPRPSPVIDNAVARIEAMRPLNTYKLERLVLILNDLPDLQIGAVIASPLRKDAPEGELRLIFRQLPAPPGPNHGVITLDNEGSRYVGPWRLGLQGNFDNVGAPYHQLQYQFELAQPLSELVYMGLNYTMPIFGASGAKLSFGGSLSHSEPGSTLKDLDIDGRTESLTTTLSYPIIRTRDQTLNASATFDYDDARTDLLSSRLYDDRLRSLRIGADYTMSDAYYGLNNASLTVSQGLNILGVRPTGSPDLSRADGETDYHKLNVALSRYQSLPADTALYVRLQGQYTNDPLLSAEEFGFGGDSIGRGYDPSEIIGDKGIDMSFELSRNFRLEEWRIGIQPYMFYDIGKIWNVDAADGDAASMSAASAGIGVRAELWNAWRASLALAFPLTRTPENPPPYDDHSRGPRLLLSLSRKF